MDRDSRYWKDQADLWRLRYEALTRRLEGLLRSYGAPTEDDDKVDSGLPDGLPRGPAPRRFGEES